MIYNIARRWVDIGWNIFVNTCRISEIVFDESLEFRQQYVRQWRIFLRYSPKNPFFGLLCSPIGEYTIGENMNWR
jgi:hypothetical protein